MNVNVQASEIEAAEQCLVNKPKPAAIKRASKPKKSFAELAAEWRAAYFIYNDPRLDDKVADKFLDKAFDIAKIMARPDVPMTKRDAVTLAQIIREARDFDPHAFNCTSVEALVMKMVDSILTSEKGVPASA
jgi:hypothetical protein